MHSLSRDDSLTRYHAALTAELPERCRVLWVDGARTAPPVVRPDVDLDHVVLPLTDPAALPSAAYAVAILSRIERTELVPVLAIVRRALSPDGRIVIGTPHAASLALARAVLAADSSDLHRGATTLGIMLATLAAAGVVVDHVRVVRSAADASPAPAIALGDDIGRWSDDDVAYHVLSGRLGDVATARRLTRRAFDAASRRAESDVLDVPTVEALVRRERQLAALDRSLGWRLLGRYGPCKHRFVLPAWRALQDRWRLLSGGGDRDATHYQRWVRFSDAFHTGGVAVRRPTMVSILVAVAGAPANDLATMVSSLLGQDHREWELRLVGVGSEGVATIQTALARVAVSEERVHVDPIARATQADATNAALTDGRGDIVLLVTTPVELAPDALSTALDAFAETGADVVYGDEDVRDGSGRRSSPALKPAWSPDWLLSWMYWPSAFFYRRAFLDPIGGLRADLEGAAHWDLALRTAETRARIVHVPRILSHAPSAATPTGGPPTPAAAAAGKRALESALVRRGIAGVVHPCAGDVYRVQRRTTGKGKVTIVVPTRDNVTMLQRCLATIETTDHAAFEIVIVDNGSTDARTLAFLAATRHSVRRAPGPFNFARLNNGAVAATTGEYLVFLNDDTEVLDPGWLRAMEEHAERPEVGAVGAKLLYPNGAVQHAGIAVGIGGLAGHPGRFRSHVPAGIRNVTAVTAACLMMRRRTFEIVGGFDERLPVNSNDVDLCLRLRDRGYLVVYTPYAVLYHHESATRGLRAIPDDAWLMTRRWQGALRADPYYSPNADRVTESGAMDLSKPDGLVCLYEGPPGPTASVRVEPGGSIGQACYVASGDLAAIVVRVRTEGDPEHALRLTVREGPDAPVTIRTVERSHPGRREGERWFVFEPIPHSGGRRWFFALESVQREAFSLIRTSLVSDVMGPTFEGGLPAYGSLAFALYARAPYRCMTTPP